MHQQSGKTPAQLDWDDLDATMISAFLNHLEAERHNSVRTRNVRLTAIRSLFSYAALRHPEHALLIQRVLAIPPKRFDKRIVTFLTPAEVDALLAAPDQSRWEGRRDRALMLLAVQTGLRVSELTGLNCGDVTLGAGANVRCEGKGRKQRAVPLTGPVEALLRTWLTERAGLPTDPLFPTRTGRRLSRDAVALRVSTHAATAATRCPRCKANRSIRTFCATPARCRCSKQASTPRSSRSGSATPASGPPTPTSTPTSPSRRRRSPSPRQPLPRPAATARRTRSWRSSKACDYAEDDSAGRPGAQPDQAAASSHDGLGIVAGSA